MKQTLAYPFLYEQKNTVEFEILTDKLASLIGLAASHANTFTFLQEELIEVATLTYHLNGSIRGKNAIKEADILFLQTRYQVYLDATNMKEFVVPQGHVIATTLHLARSMAKEVVRLMHKLRMEGHLIEENLFDFANALSDYLFTAALFANKITKTKERIFTSRSYK